MQSVLRALKTSQRDGFRGNLRPRWLTVESRVPRTCVHHKGIWNSSNCHRDAGVSEGLDLHRVTVPSLWILSIWGRWRPILVWEQMRCWRVVRFHWCLFSLWWRSPEWRRGIPSILSGCHISLISRQWWSSTSPSSSSEIPSELGTLFDHVSITSTVPADDRCRVELPGSWCSPRLSSSHRHLISGHPISIRVNGRITWRTRIKIRNVNVIRNSHLMLLFVLFWF